MRYLLLKYGAEVTSFCSPANNDYMLIKAGRGGLSICISYVEFI